MKKIISKLMGGVLLFGLSMSLTSCEDILGEWSRPTPNPVTPGGGSTINATAIALNQTMKVIKLGGDALTITATATPTDATLTWESSDEAVATVVNGVVTPVAAGIATITVKSGDVKATCEVFVGNEVALSSSAYEAKNYDILKGDMGDNQLTIPNDIKVVFNGVQTTKQIICSGDATIILADGSTNSVTGSINNEAGIRIGGAGTTLTINAETLGTGILNATGGRDAAGIGTEYIYNADVVGGNITINGGEIYATGQGSFRGAAGIGTGGASPGYKNECGAITINGGTVTATGGYGVNNSIGGAGIGTGGAGSFSSPNSTINKCGAITINGGTVTATGAQRATGIGTGTSYTQTLSDEANNTCGAITIGTGVKSVAAIKGDGAYRCIGMGPGMGGTATTNCGVIKFGTAEVFNGTAWSPSDPLTAGTYGGLTLAISGGTWTLTPSN